MDELDQSGSRHPEHLVVGHISRPHGTKGEFYVLPLTDHVDAAFREGASLRVSDPEGHRPDPLYPVVEVSGARAYRQGLLVTFTGIEERTVAEPFRGRYLLRPFQEAEAPADDEFFYHELLGMAVTTAAGEEVGTVREVYEMNPHDLLEVQRPDGEVLIPLARAIVVSVDREEGRLTVDPPRGLLEL